MHGVGLQLGIGAPMVFNSEYYQDLLRLDRPNLIALWPQTESVGTAALNFEGNTLKNGIYTGVTLDNAKFLTGEPTPLFDGVNDFNNIHSAQLNTDFNNAEGTAIIWLQVFNVGVWTDATVRRGLYMQADASNRIFLGRSSNANDANLAYRAGGVNLQTTISGMTTTDPFMLAITWSVANDEVIAYLDGQQSGAILNGLGVWAGALDAAGTLIGAQSTGPTFIWNGWLSYGGLWSTPLSANAIEHAYARAFA